MRALLALLLLLTGLSGAPGATATPQACGAAPLQLVACGDGLTFLLALGDPALQTQVLAVAEQGDVTVAAVLHSSSTASGEALTWLVLYTFPSTIFAHSIVTVPFHADEME